MQQYSMSCHIFIPLTESLLHLCSISIGDVTRWAQVAPLCALTPSCRTGAGVWSFIRVCCAWVVDHPHCKHSDVLSICLTTCTYRPTQNTLWISDKITWEKSRNSEFRHDISMRVNVCLPVASKAFMICLSEKPISNSGTAMAGGGGDVERRLLGSDNAWSE